MNASTAKPTRLAVLLRLASEENWCHRRGCTTCGADKFYGGLEDLVEEMGGSMTGRVEVAKSFAPKPLLAA